LTKTYTKRLGILRKREDLPNFTSVIDPLISVETQILWP